MKQVKSKITGNIGDLDFDSKTGIFTVVDYDSYMKVTNTTHYISLEDLCEEWEDYEEPKEYWFIDFNGEIKEFEVLGFEWQGWMKEIGNYFETKEEAELAVRKLKAWKRLKDGGITFKNWTINQTGTIDCFATWGDNIPPSRKNPTLLEDLDLLFGGEE